VSIAEADRLRAIKTFPSLVKYLRDELDWPIESDDFDDLTFDYEAEELGLDAKSAVKVKEIKQLRPLTSGQPWGIFFVNFEPKRLPVVVLRRILRALVIKKRQSANKSQQAAWQRHDLLFISAYGEADHRDITLANFFEDEENGDLPTLRVLGWDDEDTVLHLAHADEVLREKLRWPRDASDATAWRQRWSGAFTLKYREVITTSRDLAVRMAELAAAIRKRVNRVLAIESDKGPVRKLMTAFREALIHDLSEDDFADMYAQTITYGLLSARVSRPMGLVAENIRDMVPVTNPFLQDLLSQFLTVGGRKGSIDFDELGINDVVQALRDADMEAVLRDFGDKNPQEDPVVHFYELFLKEYDPKKRAQRGVFYTPRPVVSFIVRSVHELLQTDFGIEDGLASTVTWGEMVAKHPGLTVPPRVKPSDPFVVVLDPAVGTATFLVEIIDVIHRTLVTKWKNQGLDEAQRHAAWNTYVPKHLLPRIHGYELMMAPYAIAHMKLGLKLYETGYRFGIDARARIYLTNSLEPPSDDKKQQEFEELAPALAHEAQAVNAIKRYQRFTVVVGNPPYSGLSANLTDQARQLVTRFKFIDGVRLNERGALQLEKNLQDDYIKFLAFAEDRLANTGTGICGMICNHGFIDNPTLRGVRRSLLASFIRIWVLDLHGNVNRGERAPDGSDDQNVFDIKDAGVAICVGVKGTRAVTDNQIRKSDLWGSREAQKYPFLLSRTCGSHHWQDITCEPDQFHFRAISQHGAREYTRWPRVTEIFPLYSIGMITARDSYVLDFSPGPIIERAKAFRDSRLDDSATCTALGIPIKKGWNISRARARIAGVKDLRQCVRRVLYRPFDVRHVFYHESLIWGMAWPVMQHMVGGKNLALITSRMTKGENFHHVLVSNTLSEVILLSSKTSNNAFVFPLYLRPATSDLQMDARTNFSQQFLLSLADELGLQQNGTTGLPSELTPEDVFHYIYAVLHSPGYRNRYAEFLKIDFPRLPLTGDLELFLALAGMGGELVALHLMESPKLDKRLTRFVGSPGPEVEKVSWSRGTVWVDKEQTNGFAGVPEAVWNFQVGGYQVCEKWLKDRKGRTLSKDDIEHYHRIVIAISETIRLMKEIDKVIDQHGGWPLVGSVGA